MLTVGKGPFKFRNRGPVGKLGLSVEMGGTSTAAERPKMFNRCRSTSRNQSHLRGPTEGGLLTSWSSLTTATPVAAILTADSVDEWTTYDPTVAFRPSSVASQTDKTICTQTCHRSSSDGSIVLIVVFSTGTFYIMFGSSFSDRHSTLIDSMLRTESRGSSVTTGRRNKNLIPESEKDLVDKDTNCPSRETSHNARGLMNFSFEVSQTQQPFPLKAGSAYQEKEFLRIATTPTLTEKTPRTEAYRQFIRSEKMPDVMQTPQSHEFTSSDWYSGEIIREMQHSWFFGDMSSSTANRLLRRQDEGTYVIRCSGTVPGDYAISVVIGRKVRHYRVNYRKDKNSVDPVYILVLAEKRYHYSSLESLVRNCSSCNMLTTRDGSFVGLGRLSTPLRKPIQAYIGEALHSLAVFAKSTHVSPAFSTIFQNSTPISNTEGDSPSWTELQLISGKIAPFTNL
ncbi:hypothetical protein PROFUN_02193 [Planoprotostelium fungivorum]|uniref:SH2 domain-containing protein n=1 Tax=Planoprotostelium fungivorum TaxID=1890364 RepID=A0A2P6NZG6_9EUKA|nr:hypothetical protein PROFUN_02193 [Planoprotostelium fungivorum]